MVPEIVQGREVGVSYKWFRVTGPVTAGPSGCRRALESVSGTERAIKAKAPALRAPSVACSEIPAKASVCHWLGPWVAVTICKQQDCSGRKEIRAHLILIVQMGNVRPREGT